VDRLISQRLFRSAVAAVTNVLPQGFDKSSWDHVAQSLLNQVEDHDLGPEMTPAGAATANVHAYLTINRPEHDDIRTAVAARKPFITDGYLNVVLADVVRHMRLALGERVTTRELAKGLRMAGWENAAQWIPPAGQGGKGTTISVWRLREENER
jgi:hypothetical protein